MEKPSRCMYESKPSSCALQRSKIVLLLGIYCLTVLPPVSAGFFSQNKIVVSNMKHRQKTAINPNTLHGRGKYTPLHIQGGGSATPNSYSSRMLEMTTFDNSFVWQSVAITAGGNALGFLISLMTGSHLHLDLIGTGIFAVAALPSFLAKAGGLWRIKLSSGAVIAWATKLAGFLFVRALKVTHDGRLDDTLATTSGTFSFWFVSLIWGVVCALPHTLGSTSSSPGLLSTTTVGLSMFSVGFIVETLADYQKWLFKNDPLTSGQFCNVGVWSLSQHPNYFGNLLLWTGILVLNAPALIETDIAGTNSILQSIWGYRRLFLASLSPLFMMALFYGQASGAMLNTVELAKQKYGHDPRYMEYIQNVPLIVPDLLGWLRR